MKKDFLNWLKDYLSSTGTELTDEQLKEVEKQLKPKKREKLVQTEFPWKYESLGTEIPYTGE